MGAVPSFCHALLLRNTIGFCYLAEHGFIQIRYSGRSLIVKRDKSVLSSIPSIVKKLQYVASNRPFGGGTSADGQGSRAIHPEKQAHF
jgi:hypothetical protein